MRMIISKVDYTQVHTSNRKITGLKKRLDLSALVMKKSQLYVKSSNETLENNKEI